MNRLVRYATLWRALPDDERRARAGRVLERLFRRGSTVRRLGLVGDQPSWRSFERALSEEPSAVVRALRSPDHSRGPLDADLASRAEFVATRHPDHADGVLAGVRDLLRRRFDLLGSGPSRPLDANGSIDWHRDFKSGTRWDPNTFYLDVTIVRGDGSDIKVPWELSRFQHLSVLGQAYRLASHRLPGDEADALASAAAAEAAAQIDEWIESNPRGLGVNWACTMDIAIRAFNWIALRTFFR